MSQPKNETVVLVLALLITLGLLSAEIRWLSQLSGRNNQGKTNTPTNQSVSERISLGEKSLLPGANVDKQQGIAAIAQGNYAQAIRSLQTSLQNQQNYPEALIYLNNARIGKNKSYTIAASVPIGSNWGGWQYSLFTIRRSQCPSTISRDCSRFAIGYWLRFCACTINACITDLFAIIADNYY